jgi:hypothetical protein
MRAEAAQKLGLFECMAAPAAAEAAEKLGLFECMAAMCAEAAEKLGLFEYPTVHARGSCPEAGSI